ncbi:carbohydrate binding domain-containing protein [Flavobacterium limnophilum]|uniref:carbohydrate binding domain-containing protein n=1 Tax=Flavobacterium limnophilum TaxID=3003262 RepID=UPI002482382D|nr:carbohydrate binding domain-containing protein [Flavobacterium limnophilum]
MIKKLLFLLITVTCTTFTANAQNLFLNSGLEAGTGNTFTNWTTWSNPNITEETVNIHSGLRAIKAISMGTDEWSLQLISDAVTTVAGTSYEVTFWIKSVGGANTMRTSIASGTNYYQSPQTIGTTWQKVSYAFTANSTSTKVSLDLGKSTEIFYIDDLEMYSLTTNNIVNDGFELGSGDNFTNWTKLGTTANLTSETGASNVRSGARSLKAISTGTNEWDLVMQSDAVTTETGRYYEGAIWIKSVGGASKMRLSTSGGTSEYGTSVTIGSTDFQRVSIVFKATATATKLNLDLGKSTETFYIDDASFNSAQTVALGVSDFNAKNDEIVFYPNPVKDYLNINSDASIKSIIISDLAGKTVRTIKDAENIQSVDLSNLKQGMYILSTDTNKQFKFLKN